MVKATERILLCWSHSAGLGVDDIKTAIPGVVTHFCIQEYKKCVTISSVQAIGFCVTIMTIIVELQMKNKKDRYRRLAVCLVARFSSNFEAITR